MWHAFAAGRGSGADGGVARSWCQWDAVRNHVFSSRKILEGFWVVAQHSCAGSHKIFCCWTTVYLVIFLIKFLEIATFGILGVFLEGFIPGVNSLVTAIALRSLAVTAVNVGGSGPGEVRGPGLTTRREGGWARGQLPRQERLSWFR